MVRGSGGGGGVTKISRNMGGDNRQIRFLPRVKILYLPPARTYGVRKSAWKHVPDRGHAYFVDDR